MQKSDPFTELERRVHAALETYSNVHRGSGHNSMVTTHLFEQARAIVLEYLGLNKGKYTVIFCTQRGAASLLEKIKPGTCQSVSSQAMGLPLGVRAIAVNRRALPGGAPFNTGGGTTRLVSLDWVIWAEAPDKFEAGTPAIINVIAFARALLYLKQTGKETFTDPDGVMLTTTDILYHDELEKYSGRELLDALRQTLIGRGILVPTMEGIQPFINLDNSASTPTFEPIWKAVRQTWRQSAQIHQEIIKEVKYICSRIMGAPLTHYDVIFTSNTTEAINISAESFSREVEEGTEPVVLNTYLEHSSNDLPWRMSPHNSLIRLSIDAEGFLDLKELETVLIAYNQRKQYGNKRIRLVAVSGASNVLGVCNDVAEISRIVHLYGAHLLVDAAQLVAHRKVGMEQSGIDYLAFSAHKLYAPFGTGVLIAKKGVLKFSSAEMNLINSSGEENAGGIAALGKALLLLERIGMELIREEEQDLTRRTLLHLAQIPGLEIYGIKDPGSPAFDHKMGVIVFSMKNMMANRVAEKLAEMGGIGVRYGCHCAHILIKHILGVGPRLAQFQKIIAKLFPGLSFPGVVRISFGIGNNHGEIDKLIHVLQKIGGRPGALSDEPFDAKKDTTFKIPKTKVKQQVNDFKRDVAQRVYSQF